MPPPSAGGSSFERLFPRAGGPLADKTGNDAPPSVHELFSATMRDEMTAMDLAQALAVYHSIRMSPAAMRLMTSVEATSGRLPFSQFQKALQSGGPIDEDAASQGAGLRSKFQDQAKAIISDNAGVPCPSEDPLAKGATKPSTDVTESELLKQQRLVQKIQAQGPFSSNPVVATNHVSRGNPLAELGAHGGAEEDPYGIRAVVNTLTREFIGGEMTRGEFERFIAKLGVELKPDSDLSRLIVSHASVSDGDFRQMSRALQREVDLCCAGS
mmetsp:Transcript_68842/g.165254  ORF Transcript_68842/g.165254 Transcript_68842/m.165254 type:complete len:270 (-) Transcript_68842:74-883(-)